MRHRFAVSVRAVIFAALLVCAGCGSRETVVRFATFNASLNRDEPGQLVQHLSTPHDEQAKNVAEIVQRVRPDVLLINEFDRDDQRRAAELFRRNYLLVAQNGAEPIDYPYMIHLPVNTGIHGGHDLDNDGRVISDPGARGYGNDALGFGQFPGQYGMLLLSRYPLDSLRGFRTFQLFLWKDMPGAMLPTTPDGSPWYGDEERAVLRLSSKSHWDIPLRINRRVVHVLASHPTPPAFDGAEDRNGRRNHDEIRLWADYVRVPPPEYIVSDTGEQGSGVYSWRWVRGLSATMRVEAEPFVILGDLNADPHDGNSIPGAIQQLLDHPRVDSSFVPSSDGAAEASQLQGGKNESHTGDAVFDTADFSDEDPGPGNLRVDYVLPSKDLAIRGGGVFWPALADPLHRLVEMNPVASSDHRMVWLDVAVRRK